MGTGTPLAVATAADERDAELQRLREENARLAQKRDNDERSAFGRLEKEAELRKQREHELEEMRRRLAELEAAQVERSLTPAQLDALGTDGVSAVRAIVEKTVPRPATVPDGSDKAREMEERLARLEQSALLENARRSYSAGVAAYAHGLGVGPLLPRLAEGGDLGERWKAFVGTQPDLQSKLDAMDLGATNMALHLFLYQNPDIASPAPSPSEAGGFPPSGGAPAYGQTEWLADTARLDSEYKAGRLTLDQVSKGYADATAKLSAAQKR